MSRSVTAGIVVVFLAAAVVAVLALIFLTTNRTAQTDADLSAAAAMVSPAGAAMGTVIFDQQGDAVVVAMDVNGLMPGGHAVFVHAVGSCSPDFSAAGDHFEVERGSNGIIHPSWKRDPIYGEHGGDLPNIYAHADGSVRADFVTDGFTLRAGEDHSIFDADGSAIVIHEHPQAYGAAEGNTGARVACGVIERNR